ncbi:hypothetical protein SynA1825c_00825 [Synechococcus sp. A18-25c]|nr:hypothetical protein SynA1825c_00825 [Synechococcus sp. A18-25c]
MSHNVQRDLIDGLSEDSRLAFSPTLSELQSERPTSIANSF